MRNSLEQVEATAHKKNILEAGLQAGKELAQKVDAFISLRHLSEKNNFDPVKRAGMSDGSVVYHWQKRAGLDENVNGLCDVLDEYTAATASVYNDEEWAFRYVVIKGDGAGRVCSNKAGLRLFTGLDAASGIVFPPEWSDSEEQRLFVYKEYCDAWAYGEEIIEVYASRGTARARLKARVEKYFGRKWEEIPESEYFADADDFSEDRVSCDSGAGTSFWMIEEKRVVSVADSLQKEEK